MEILQWREDRANHVLDDILEVKNCVNQEEKDGDFESGKGERIRPVVVNFFINF